MSRIGLHRMLVCHWIASRWTASHHDMVWIAWHHDLSSVVDSSQGLGTYAWPHDDTSASQRTSNATEHFLFTSTAGGVRCKAQMHPTVVLLRLVACMRSEGVDTV